MPRKDFEFFFNIRVIDSPVYSQLGSRDSGEFTTVKSWLIVKSCIHHQGVETPWWWIHHGVGLNRFTKNLLVQNTLEVKTPLLLIHGESLLPGLFFTRKFFCKPVLMLVLNTPRSPPGVFITAESNFSVYSSLENRDSDFTVYSAQRSRDSPMHSSPGSCFKGSFFGHRGVVLPIFKSIQKSLKGQSF